MYSLFILYIIYFYNVFIVINMNIIEEEQIVGLDNNPAKFKYNKYPVSNHPKLQNPYFISFLQCKKFRENLWYM